MLVGQADSQAGEGDLEAGGPGLQWRWLWAGGTEGFLQAEPKPRLPSRAADLS